jgi:hypothetical protein
VQLNPIGTQLDKIQNVCVTCVAKPISQESLQKKIIRSRYPREDTHSNLLCFTICIQTKHPYISHYWYQIQINPDTAYKSMKILTRGIASRTILYNNSFLSSVGYSWLELFVSNYAKQPYSIFIQNILKRRQNTFM